jgi:hypothetical protein
MTLAYAALSELYIRNSVRCGHVTCRAVNLDNFFKRLMIFLHFVQFYDCLWMKEKYLNIITSNMNQDEQNKKNLEMYFLESSV